MEKAFSAGSAGSGAEAAEPAAAGGSAQLLPGCAQRLHEAAAALNCVCEHLRLISGYFVHPLADVSSGNCFFDLAIFGL